MGIKKFGRTTTWTVGNEIVFAIGPDWCFSIVMLIVQLVISTCFLVFIHPGLTNAPLRVFSFLMILGTLSSFLVVVLKDPGIATKSVPRKEFTPIPEDEEEPEAEGAETGFTWISDEDDDEDETKRLAIIGRQCDEVSQDTDATTSASPRAKRTSIRFSPDIENPNTKLCTKCRILAAPGTYHCDDCGVCILELDHHCPWTSKCVGKGNLHAFYIWVIMAILTLGAIFCCSALFLPTAANRPHDIGRLARFRHIPRIPKVKNY